MLCPVWTWHVALATCHGKMRSEDVAFYDGRLADDAAPAAGPGAGRLREERGMTIRQAAGALEWDPSKLSRVEGLQRGIIVRDVRRLLDLYQVTSDADREALFELSREAKQRGWWQAYADVMPSDTPISSAWKLRPPRSAPTSPS